MNKYLVVYGLFSATSGVPGFGTLNYAGNPVFFQRTSREIQFALKLYY